MPAIGAIADDFEDGTINETIWSANYGTRSETGGRARVGCATDYSAFASGKAYTLAASAVFVRVYPPVDGGATDEAFAQVLVTSATDGTDAVMEVNMATGMLGMGNRIGYVPQGGFGPITYDPVAHAWLRIREAGGSTFFETAPDGLTWTVRRTITSPAWVSDATIQLQLLAHRDAGTPDFAEFDSVNTAPAAGTPAVRKAAFLAFF